jgi:hypothetical protein
MDSMSDLISDAKNDAPGSDRKLKRKDYEQELARYPKPPRKTPSPI